MDITKDILPLTEFKRDTSRFIAHLQETGRPSILTINGKPSLVVMDAETWQETQDQLEYARTVAGIRKGLTQAREGQHTTASTFLETSTIFTPDNEPYLGLTMVHQLDQIIISTMEVNGKIAKWTNENTLSDLQMAASEIIPHGFSIALSIRELIRHGYLFSAEILIRPLMERAAVISYLSDHNDKIELWKTGWPYKSRPSLKEMLKSMHPDIDQENENIIGQLVQRFHVIVHANPAGASRNLVKHSSGLYGFSASKILNNPEKANDIAFYATMFLSVLFWRTSQIFPMTKK